MATKLWNEGNCVIEVDLTNFETIVYARRGGELHQIAFGKANSVAEGKAKGIVTARQYEGKTSSVRYIDRIGSKAD